MIMKTICAGCGTELKPDAPQGLCPQCLLKAGLETQADPAASHGPNSGFSAPAPAELTPFFPQLEILELLGQGGMGVVYKARQPGLDRLVALKLLSPTGSKDPSFAQRFAQEARSLARLSHPNIVAVYDFGQAGPYFYLLMEYVDGVNLRQSLRQISPDQALAIVPKICEALQYAHEEGIVHRDIKPENILVDKKGRVKIADFGLARLLGQPGAEARLTRSQQVMGTPHYMAPEQIEKPLEVDHRADIFSLGVVFYEMLTGELPVGRFPLPSTKAHVDARLDDVVLRTLEKEPQRRYQQAKELKTEVENISGIVESLPPHMRRVFGFEYKTKATLFGLPLMHVAMGMDPVTGRRRIAKGILAIGDMAKGVFALGGIAMGGICMGGVAIGILPVGGCALGLLSIGGLGLGLLYAYSGLAVAPIAMGGLALGYYSSGGAAFGAHPWGGNAHTDPVAADFFRNYNFGWVHMIVWTLVALSMFASLLVPLLSWLLSGKQAQASASRRTTEFRPGSTPPPHPPTASSAGEPPLPPPRFSRSAIIGALWIPFFLVAFFGMYMVQAQVVTQDGTLPPRTLFQNLMTFTVLPLGLLAPFGTTILGSVSLGRIRRSKGRIIGLPLALADALFFPLLILDAVLFVLWYVLSNKFFPDSFTGPNQGWLEIIRTLVVFVLPIVGLLALDAIIAFYAWRGAKKPVT